MNWTETWFDFFLNQIYLQLEFVHPNTNNDYLVTIQLIIIGKLIVDSTPLI